MQWGDKRQTLLPGNWGREQARKYTATIGSLKQQRRRRLPKRYLKGEFALIQNFIALIPTRSVRQMLANFSGVEF